MKKFNLLIAVCSMAILPLISPAQTDESSEIQQIEKYLLDVDEGLDERDVSQMKVTDRYRTAHNGANHLYLRQTVHGLPIINTSATAVLNASGQPVGVSHRFVSLSDFDVESPEAKVEAVAAAGALVARELPGLGIQVEGVSTPEGERLSFAGESYEHHSPVELVYYADPEHELKLAWSFDVDFPDHSHWYRYIVSARTGELLKKYDWVVSCAPVLHRFVSDEDHAHGSDSPVGLEEQLALTPFDGSAYRVFSLPVESPNHGSRSLLVEPADPVASPYGWHDNDGVEGPEFDITRGNNVYAYEDANDTNFPGFSPSGGSALEFDFAYDPSSAPEVYRSAAITNLFYMTNRLHDVLYHYGFDEVAGNFQDMNYTGVGGDGDALMAEAQDGGGTNNANMATPNDGNSPRMQMYLWETGDSENEGLVVHEPSVLSGTYSISPPAAFGPNIPAEGITAELVLAQDGAGDVHDLCSAPTNAGELDGKIALVRRGSCNFTDKVENVQSAGAIAAIVVNNVSGSVITMGGASNNVVIPSVMISMNDGEDFITSLQNGATMSVTLAGVGGEGINDGSFDNGIIAHEFVHGLSNRLTGGPSSSICLSNEEQPGEGWSDWYAIMLTLSMDAENPVHRPMATFAAGQETDGVGIRPVAYDTSFASNDYTYADLSSTSLTVPHGIGFVWATMLWDLSWAFINEYGFDADAVNGTSGNNMVMQLVTDGLKLQPCEPGFVDARDAILLADDLANGGVNKCLIWKVFAKRGLGYSADQGSSNSRFDGTAAFDLPPQCQNATTPPIADFAVDNTETCNGLVQFEDLSSQIPQSWLWDFGDGEISNEQNPIHQYTEEGTYTVTLTVSNNMGEDEMVQTDYIEFDAPNQPQVNDVSACAGHEVELVATATGEGQIRWRNADMEPISVGETLMVQAGSIDSTYYAEQVIGDLEPGFVGPLTGAIGAGVYHQTDFVGTVDFVVHQPLTILSAWVDSEFAGTRAVNLYGAAGGTGAVLQTVLVDIDFVGGGRVDLNLTIDEPGEYSIGLNQAGLFRNDGGVDYPYTLADWMTITGSSAGPDYYYYFYDLEVRKQVCVGETAPVTVNVTGNAQFDYVEDNLTLTFDALSDASPTDVWDFGDGSTSTEANPTHSYAESGVYTVTHTTEDGCTFEMSIAVGITEVVDAATAGFHFYPNPAVDRLTLDFPREVMGKEAYIEVYSATGSAVVKKRVTAGNSVELKLSSLAAGVYTAAVRVGDIHVSHRFVIAK